MLETLHVGTRAEGEGKNIAVLHGKITDVEIPGTLPQIPEWNWWNDPDAVQIVVGHDWATRPLVVPIEVTIPGTDIIGATSNGNAALRTGDHDPTEVVDDRVVRRVDARPEQQHLPARAEAGVWLAGAGEPADR